MYIALAVIFILLAAGGAFGIIRYVLLPALDFPTKKWLLAGSYAIPVVGTVLLILCTLIPSKMDTGTQKGIQTFEEYLNAVSPDFCDQVLDKEQLRQVISDSRSLRTYLDDNTEVNWIVKAVGVNTYISYLESFANGIDTHLTAFEATEQPFTLHNILTYVQTESHQPVCTATIVLEIVVFVFMLLAFGVIYFLYISEQKGWFKETSVTFGDNIR